ncbi:D-alanine--D-alanine ligase [Candidatus Saccharibacteria bacterium]|nr:D-alanine--D-alanine ligase [Candidatus Saccharibacteria bacterium]
MSKTRVLVIGGGPSPEREIALLSSKAVFSALDGDKYDKEFYDWDGSSEWLENNLAEFDVVLPILHGVGGEDGTVQAIIEDAGVAYLGSDAKTSALCFDKDRTLTKLREASIQIPEGDTVTYTQYRDHPLAREPHVLKPFKGGSSIDTFIISDVFEIPHDQIKASFAKYETMLLEDYIDGVEITVPILNGATFPIIEIQPPKNGTFDYINKYNGKTRELCPPQNVSKELQKQANGIAMNAYKTLGCRHLARIDMIVRDDIIYTLEVNTLPGMTSQSLFPKSFASIGISFPDLVQTLVELVQKGSDT